MLGYFFTAFSDVSAAEWAEVTEQIQRSIGKRELAFAFGLVCMSLYVSLFFL